MVKLTETCASFDSVGAETHTYDSFDKLVKAAVPSVCVPAPFVTVRDRSYTSPAEA